MAISDREKTKDHGSVSIFYEYVFFSLNQIIWAKEKDFVFSDCILKLRKQVQSFLYWSFVSDFLKLGEIEKLRTARFLAGVA